ncbi:MAG: VOC family protein [Gammaproteobacteria bacterium]|jgi:glyoxylase I family protein
MSEFAGIHHASVIVQDTARAVAFYVDVLGMELESARPDLGFDGAWLRVGNGQQIHLLELPDPDAGREPPPHAGRDRHMALRVRGLDAVRARLEQEGIGYTLSRSGRRALFCRDPDGNGIELIELAQSD